MRSLSSVRMVQPIHAVLRNALEPAVREEIISRNVVKVSASKYKANRGLTVVQARDFLKAAQDERLYALYVLALCLGLRRRELLGLRWDDFALVECHACDGEVDGDEVSMTIYAHTSLDGKRTALRKLGDALG